MANPPPSRSAPESSATGSLPDLLARAGNVFSLAGELGRAFQEKHQSPLVSNAPSLWKEFKPKFGEYAQELKSFADVIRQPPPEFGPVAEVLKRAAKVGRMVDEQRKGNDGFPDYLGLWPELFTISKKGQVAIAAVMKAERLDDPFSFLDAPAEQAAALEVLPPPFRHPTPEESRRIEADLRRFAEDLRTLRFDDPCRGQEAVERQGGKIARYLASLVRKGLFPVHLMSAPEDDTDRQWWFSWTTLVCGLAILHPHRLLRYGVSRPMATHPAGGKALAGHAPDDRLKEVKALIGHAPEDWQEEFKEYAIACELLAEDFAGEGAAVEQPSGDQSQDQSTSPRRGRARRKGRPKADFDQEQREQRLADNWTMARDKGISKAEFAYQMSMPIEELDRLLERVQKRSRKLGSE